MRGFDCQAPDGTHPDTIHFEGETDEDIYGKTQDHLAQYHLGLGMDEQAVREMIANGSYEMVRDRAETRS